ncbi:PCI-domain-containing protein [Fomitiporia mediterranea MF3/22]|uniref:PCI-domain-containing protein n=1 Tax=Fomitiporia mediterranea (strain MF3/22) TaxID=694068 RepID=UPI00044097B7|nr:PCI-domain-containing protein [Fomitiporia mediterranea MF3/22]EJD03731.1 PCI-domain-containing protein [Fomitiporia mediterranea MF3/22]
MDDDDADYMQGSEDEDYGFDYSDGDEADETGTPDLENLYYSAKALKGEDPEEALAAFKRIVTTEESKSDWGFKALKQATKLLFKVLHRPDEALETYTQLLSYTKTAVTRNYAEKSINSILDYVGTGQGDEINVNVLEKFYQVTLDALSEARNERLSAKTNLKLAKLWLDRREFGRLENVIRQLHQETEESEDQQSRGTQLLEIYALEIQMYNETKNYKKLKEIYNATNEVRSAIPHPRIMGVIKECGGKMWMGERQWSRASEDFFQSFNSYNDAGSPQRIQVLKYLVLANMLTGSEVNPFDTQETKPYKADPQIKAMTDLVDAYQRREVHTAERILKENQATIMGDPFIQSYIGDLLRSLRTSYLIDLIKPYMRLELSFLARQLNVETDEVEEMLMDLILEGKVQGRIDQVGMRLELDRQQKLEKRRYTALEKWTEAIEGVHAAITQKAGNRNGESSLMGAPSILEALG